MGPIHSLDDFLDMVRRHFRLISGLVLLGCLLSLIHASNQEHMYSSSEVIQIERPKIARDLAPTTVAGSSARRLQQIEQQIMARSSLLEIIEKFDLYGDVPAMTLTEKVNRLRFSVRMEGVAAAREGYSEDGTISVLTITADMPTPQLAQAVAQEISDRTVALSASSRAEQARVTLEFFARQEETLTAELMALEDEIARFRAANDLAIPGALELRREEISTINRAILEIDRDRISLQRELEQVDRSARASTVQKAIADLQARLDSLDQQRSLLTERAAALADSIETSPEIARDLASFERQRSQLQSRLDVAAARRAEAEVGMRLESRSNAETLTVIEAAVLPDYPYTASRKKLALMGAAASVLGALVVAFLLDWRRPVIRTAAQMQREIGILPVVSIPVLKSKPVRISVWARLRLKLADLADARRLARLEHHE